MAEIYYFRTSSLNSGLFQYWFNKYGLFPGCGKHDGPVKSKTLWLINCVWHHDNVIQWKHFPRYWPFVQGIHRSPVNSPHKGQWRGALMFSLICVWINNREAGDLRCYRAHYDVIVMMSGGSGWDEPCHYWFSICTLWQRGYVQLGNVHPANSINQNRSSGMWPYIMLLYSHMMECDLIARSNYLCWVVTFLLMMNIGNI